jgi:Dolichyl-phosphate-mannose-protein mannosyltransferase
VTSLRERAARVPVAAIVVLALVLLAALTRLPGLDQRGRWDADQGHDMMVLRALVTDGQIPLLGPPTSIGTFHHGAVYYYLLAPAAIVSGADPVAVTGWIALFGIAAVAAIWWLARLAGGPLAGALAGLLAAVSPAGIDESTFIWNPNLIPVAAALAFGGVLRARQTGRTRWWLLAATGAMATMQCHVLGVVVLPPLVLAWLLEVRRRRSAGAPLGSLLWTGVASLAILAAGYVPLAIHELQTGFTETRAILDYLGGGGRSTDTGLLTRVGLVGWRSVTWPLVGLVTDRPLVSAVATVIVAVLGTVAVLVGRAADRAAVRWLLAVLAWSVVALAIFAPSLATVTPGLPNDHYHAFLDPIVLAMAGVGLARLAAGIGRMPVAKGRVQVSDGRLPVVASRALAVGLTVVLVMIGVTAWLPLVAADGGWRLVDEAAARVAQTVGGEAVLLDGIPPFKSDAALRFPLLRDGVRLLDDPQDRTWANAVLVCDPLFEPAVGAACGGPAEDAWLAGDATRSGLLLVDRFEAGPRRVISVYAPAAP